MMITYRSEVSSRLIRIHAKMLRYTNKRTEWERVMGGSMYWIEKQLDTIDAVIAHAPRLYTDRERRMAHALLTDLEDRMRRLS